MSIDRKEPIIDTKDVLTLEDRVKLTWRDVRDLASEGVEPRLGRLVDESRRIEDTNPSTPSARETPSPRVAPIATPTPVAPPSRTSVTVSTDYPQDAPYSSPIVPSTPLVRQVVLTEEEKAELIRSLSIEVEARVREAISTTIEMSLSNAMNRVRTDIDRALSSIVADAVSREMQKIDVIEKK